jgi:hypothetical protein
MTTTIATATATYRIRTVRTGRAFGHFAVITSNRRRLLETETHATPRAAIEAAERWIARQA